MKATQIYQPLAILLAFFLISCSGSDKPQDKELSEEDKLWKQSQEQRVETLALPDQLKQMQDSIYRYETLAFRSEENKINGMYLLIEEIEQSLTSPNASAVALMKETHAAAKATLYTKANMADEAAMEDYDKKVDAMVEAMKAFREGNASFERHARAKLIYDDIMIAYDSDLFIRSHYNIAVSSYNKLLAAKASEIKALGADYKRLKPYPFFYGKDPVLPEA